ncbi:MAG: PIN domain-containing protein [Candidatus Thermoplasmatota archaeon]
MHVVADANGLMMPFQFDFNLEAEILRVVGVCEILVPSSVYEELRRLCTPEANAALALLSALTARPKDRLRARIVESRMKGDEAIIHLAREYKAPALTADRGIIARLNREGLSILRLRQKRYLELRGGI